MVLMRDAAQRHHLEGVVLRKRPADQREIIAVITERDLFEYRIINMSQSGLDALAIMFNSL